MTGDEFVRLGQSLYGTAMGWQHALARQLDVGVRTVQRWCANGPPDRVRAELLMSAGVTGDDGMTFPRDEWIIGEGPPTETGQRREYIIHARMPRFIARIVRTDEETDDPEPTEGEVETMGIQYRVDPGSILCELQWIDRAPPNADLMMLMEAACNAIDEENATLDQQQDMSN